MKNIKPEEKLENIFDNMKEDIKKFMEASEALIKSHNEKVEKILSKKV